MSSPAHVVRSALVASLFTLVSLASGEAAAQTGVSDDRVSLPDGPGSLDGIGDNAAIDPNMGAMSYRVEIEVPPGFPGVTPDLALSYSSGAGQSPVGIGWSMSLPFIERMTSRGLPEYVEDDRFVADGSTQLVRVSDASAEPAVYRARFEGGFVRYSWHERGDGGEGYWTAEHPDGRVSYFGADEQGQVDDFARVHAPDGVFRYLLVATVDPFGHAIRYGYRYYGSTPLIDTISWVFDDAGDAAHSMTFDYEERTDRVSDARGGFNELLAHRLSKVQVWTGGTEIRRYALVYESDDDSGGMSRLRSVTQYGAAGGQYPVAFTFQYSRSLGGVCSGEDCVEPYLVDLGNIGGNVLESGRGTLMDMNGDALPDLIVSHPDGSPHQIFLSQMSADGVHTFAPPFSSSLQASGGFILTDNTIQELDYDGDGFADLVDHITGQVLVNKGTGDWVDTASLGDGSGGLDTSADGDFEDASSLSAADGELKNIKYFDYDGDRRIDILKATAESATTIMRNVGEGGFVVATGVEDLGASFQDDNLELADMNGDGLLDPVKLLVAGVEYKLNLGRGRWSTTWTQVVNSPLTEPDDLPRTSLEDINGDGIDDLVVVDTTEIRYAINRNGAVFDPVETISSAGGVAIPQRDAMTSVLFADMNGNGSNDVVWVDGAGNVTYLELFPVRPNLLSRIENGIGMVTEVTYGTSIEQRALDGGVGWDAPLPMPMIVATTIDTWALSPLAGGEQHDLQTYRFHAGFYDGVEKQFRGFARVALTASGDEHHEATTVEYVYDVGDGVDRAHMAGRQLSKRISGPSGPLVLDENTWDECALEGVPESGLDFPIRWVCLTHTRTTEMEARPAEEHVVIETELSYDGYGNEVLRASHGITSIGGGGCGPCASGAAFGEPCGEQCLGDESFVAASYADPALNDNWLLRVVVETSESATLDGRAQVERHYYDGPAFEGLPAGTVERGGLVRTEAYTGEDGVVLQLVRNQLDEHGNVVVALTPRATVDGTGHRSTATYSDDGLDVIGETLEVTGEDGVYRLARRYTYEPLFGLVESATPWFLEGEEPEGAQRWSYDEHGRVERHADVGAELSDPTERYVYDVESPVSRLVTLRRSEAGGDHELEQVSCVDGLGRELMTRTRLAADRWLVTGYNVLDRRGEPVRIHQTFESDTGECDLDEAPPSPYSEHYYDALGREIRVVHPDTGEAGGPAERQVRYLPKQTVLYSEDDVDPDAPGYDTPSVMVYDGLERVVRVERQLEAGAPPITHRLTYDDLGMLSGYVDAEGNVKSMRRDLAGRVLEVNDPDAGRLTFEYDEASAVVRQTDGAGRVLLREYDDQGRKVAEWDPADREGTLVTHVYDRDPSCPGMTCTSGAGRLVTTTFAVPRIGTVTERYGYDGRGRQVTTLREVGGASFRFEARYDDADRLVHERFPDGREIDYEIDGADRIVAVPGYIERIVHGEHGLVSRYELANGTVTEYEHDERLRLTAIRAEGAGGGSVVDLGLELDRRGSVMAVDDRVGVGGKPTGGARYTYDGLNRLLEASLDESAGAPAETTAYTYDDLDRVLSKTSTSEASAEHVGALRYEADQPRAVSEAGGVSLEYDAGGYVTRRGEDEYAWNARGRLESVRREGSEIARYGYGPYGMRFSTLQGASSRLTLSPTYELRDGVARLALSIDGARVVEEDAPATAARLFPDGDDDDAITAADAWLARGSSDAGTMLRAAARRALAAVAPRAYLHTDHLGSVVAVTDEDGAVTERASYHPYGAVRDSTAKNTEHLRYSGHEHDETGLLDYGERVYSPREGRWLSPDPAFTILTAEALKSIGDLFAVYAFTGNNPTSAVDDDGTLSTKAKVGLGAAAAVVAGAAITAGMLTGVLPAAIGAAVAAATVVNVVGAVVGGVVGGVKESIVQYKSAKARYTANGRKMPFKAKALAVGKVLLSTAKGAVSGFFSGGLSAVPTVAEGVVSVAESKGKLSPGKASVLRGVIGVARAVVDVANPLGLATAGGSAATAALSIAGTALTTAAVEGVTYDSRKKQSQKAKRGVLHKKLMKAIKKGKTLRKTPKSKPKGAK